MKHETINSLGVSLSVLLGLVSIYLQYAPKSDDVRITSEGRINTSQPVEIVDDALPKFVLSGDRSLIGPIFWKVRAYNASDRGTSIVSFSVIQKIDGKDIYYSEMKESLLKTDQSLTEQQLPDNIGPRETTAFLVSLYVPMAQDTDKDGNCTTDRHMLSKVEQCLFLKGRDLFGNPVETIFDWSTPPNLMSMTWKGEMISPVFELQLETADGSIVREALSYYSD